MRIEKRTMGWFPKQSAWDHQQSLNAKRKAQAESSISEMSSLATALTTARDSVISGQAELAAKVALARVQKTA